LVWGDYWKRRKLQIYLLNFLNQRVKYPNRKLAITVLLEMKLPRDEESSNAWKKMGIPEK